MVGAKTGRKSTGNYAVDVQNRFTTQNQNGQSESCSSAAESFKGFVLQIKGYYTPETAAPHWHRLSANL
jgi:hypothetical protein